jgi:hypothetical protein
MATKSVHGATIKVLDGGTFVYSLMEDGIILSQWRYNGRLQPAKVESRRFKGQAMQVVDRLVIHHGALRVRKATQTFDHERPIGPCPCGRNIFALRGDMLRCDVDNDVAELYLEQVAKANRKIKSAMAH